MSEIEAALRKLSTKFDDLSVEVDRTNTRLDRLARSVATLRTILDWVVPSTLAFIASVVVTLWMRSHG